MPVTILVGAQWGDEGKGRVADWLAAESDVVSRYAGGDNAGHTVYVGDEMFALHLLPSGILNDGVTCVLGSGMVVNPIRLRDEINNLYERGVLTPENVADRLVMSTRAHIITPGHIALDKLKEQLRGSGAIGTTQRGIGPAYMDKTGRRGVRAGVMAEPEAFGDAVRDSVAVANESLKPFDLHIDANEAAAEYTEVARFLNGCLKDTTAYLHDVLKDGKRVLCEGAQGTMLDIDHGDYPFVTSSSPTAGGALTGLGFGPTHVDRVVGVTKAFSTRVGAGPLPTELDDAVADHLRGTGENFWDEFGTTTGRPRRCGWLDAVMLRYSAQVNGFTEMVLTKLDILSGLDTLQVAVAYNIDGKRYDFPPFASSDIERAVPVYETLPGWQDNISGARKLGDLPQAAQDYIKRVEAWVGVPIRTVSVGPEREQLVHL